MGEKVAICTLIEDAKAALLPLLVPRWNVIDLGGRELEYVVCMQDASRETARAFRDLATAPVRFIRAENLTQFVTGPDGARGPVWHPALLLRIALMREAVRVAALATGADWFLWLDSDIDPEDDEGAPCFGTLHWTYTSTTGPLAPRFVSGLYCTRFGGQPITQWLDGYERRYVYTKRDAVQAARVAGFGCMLVHRDVMQWASWDRYNLHIANRQAWIDAHPGEEPPAIIGEDCWLLRVAEGSTAAQVPCYTDNRVRCRHYHADGSYWHFVNDGDDGLRPAYVRAGLAPGAGIRVRYTGAEPLTWPILGDPIQPGEVTLLSPELVETLRAVIPDQYEEVAA